ncbi:MAG: SIS domain-containing protein [Halioglobus sp.]|nr:SIS domain-containing protein [Halioglobus sp.]
MGRLLAELADSGARRSKSARRIASYVLAQPAEVVNLSIGALASEVGVSEPTVGRFCTGLGLKGFPDFKLTLAAELARQDFHVAGDIDAGDSCADVMTKVFDAAHASLQATLGGLDPGAVEAVAEQLRAARSILIVGQGASASVAQDAQHKMLRFNVPVLAPADNLTQRMTAAGMGANDCLLCISYTGRTRPVIEIAELATSAGATVIGLTAPASPLAEAAQFVLPVASGEDTDIYIPMSSRLAQLAVIDVLTTRLAMAQGQDYPAQFRRIKQSQLSTRTSKTGGVTGGTQPG